VKPCVPLPAWEERHSDVVDALRQRSFLADKDDEVRRQREQNRSRASSGLTAGSGSPSMASTSISSFMRPSASMVDEQWARALCKKGLCIDLVDDPEFRNAVLMTARAGLSYVDANKSETLLPHRTKMSTGHIPDLDTKIHAKMSKKIYGLIKETGGQVCSGLT
jgi:hypothetical protein